MLQHQCLEWFTDVWHAFTSMLIMVSCLSYTHTSSFIVLDTSFHVLMDYCWCEGEYECCFWIIPPIKGLMSYNQYLTVKRSSKQDQLEAPEHSRNLLQPSCQFHCPHSGINFPVIFNLFLTIFEKAPVHTGLWELTVTSFMCNCFSYKNLHW